MNKNKQRLTKYGSATTTRESCSFSGKKVVVLKTKSKYRFCEFTKSVNKGNLESNG